MAFQMKNARSDDILLAVGPNFLTINYKLLNPPPSSSSSSLSLSLSIESMDATFSFRFWCARFWIYIFPLNRTYICLSVKIFAPEFELFKHQWENQPLQQNNFCSSWNWCRKFSNSFLKLGLYKKIIIFAISVFRSYCSCYNFKHPISYQ